MSEREASFRILIADDEEPIIDVLCRHFEKWGYRCDSAKDGAEALAKIIESPPDLLVTDIKMPVMDGLELIDRIKSEGIVLPVVVITAYFDIDNAIQALRLGAMNFFKKPFEFSAIHDTIFKIERLKTGKAERLRALTYLENGRLKFTIPSNIDLIDGVSWYITERAIDLGIVKEYERFYTQLAIDEAISNAILHGNFQIKKLESAGKEQATREKLYRIRASEPGYVEKKVEIDAEIVPARLTVTVTDEGEGFDKSEIPDPTDTENVFRYHGRGIFVMKNVMDSVEFNEAGNSITLIKKRSTGN